MDHPSPTRRLLKGWEQGDESQERGLSGAGQYLEVTPGDTAKSATGDTQAKAILYLISLDTLFTWSHHQGM